MNKFRVLYYVQARTVLCIGRGCNLLTLWVSCIKSLSFTQSTHSPQTKKHAPKYTRAHIHKHTHSVSWASTTLPAQQTCLTPLLLEAGEEAEEAEAGGGGEWVGVEGGEEWGAAILEGGAEVLLVMVSVSLAEYHIHTHAQARTHIPTHM
jgi:hypothetical protein